MVTVQALEGINMPYSSPVSAPKPLSYMDYATSRGKQSPMLFGGTQSTQADSPNDSAATSRSGLSKELSPGFSDPMALKLVHPLLIGNRRTEQLNDNGKRHVTWVEASSLLLVYLNGTGSGRSERL